MTFSPTVTADGTHTLPPTRLTLLELHREIRRLAVARDTLPLGAARDAAIERQWTAHRERATRLCLLALSAGFPLS